MLLEVRTENGSGRRQLSDAPDASDALSLLTTTPAYARAYRDQIGKVRQMRQCVSADALARLAQQVSRLCPDRRDPHRFHEDKSEIVAELRNLARALNAK